MGVLSSECGSECVAVSQRTAVVLHVELPTHCQEAGLAKQILLVVELSLFKGNLLLHLYNHLHILNFFFLFLLLGFSHSLLGLLILLLFFGLSFILLFVLGFSFLSLSFLLLCLLIFLLLLLRLCFILLLFLRETIKGGDLGNSIMRFRQESCDLEHLSSTLTVGCSDDGSVHIEEPTFLEEQVSGKGQVVSDSGNSSNQVGSGSQVSNATQKL